MQKAKPVVELIPWVHNIYSSHHEDVVNYVRSLPRNSFLALESSIPAIQAKTESLLHLPYGKQNMGRRELVQTLGRFPLNEWAALEILLECTKRNISIIPLYSSTLLEMSKSTRASPSRNLKIEQFREISFGGQIASFLKNFKGEKLPAITGLLHSSNTERELQKIGINSKINLDIFRNPDKLKRLINIGEEVRKATREGMETDREVLQKNIRDCLEDSETRTEAPADIRFRIMDEIYDSWETQKNRMVGRTEKTGRKAIRHSQRV